MSGLQAAAWSGALATGAREAILSAHRLGFDGLLLPGLEGELTPGEMGESARREVRHLLEKRSLRLAGLTGRLIRPGQSHDLDLLTEDAEEAFGLVRDLGGSAWVLSLDALADAPAALLSARTSAALKVLLAVAARVDVTLAIATGVESADAWVPVFARFPSPLLGLSYDPARAHLFGDGDAVDFAATLAERIALVRWRDVRRLGAWKVEEYAAALESEGSAFHTGAWWVEAPLGDGEVPFAELERVLLEHGSRAWAVLGRQFGKHREDSARVDLAYLRGSASEAPPASGRSEAGG